MSHPGVEYSWRVIAYIATGHHLHSTSLTDVTKSRRSTSDISVRVFHSQLHSEYSLGLCLFCTILYYFKLEIESLSFVTALHGMQTLSSDENSVCLSVCLCVCLSVKRVHCDKTDKRAVQVFILYERSVF